MSNSDDTVGGGSPSIQPTALDHDLPAQLAIERGRNVRLSERIARLEVEHARLADAVADAQAVTASAPPSSWWRSSWNRLRLRVLKRYPSPHLQAQQMTAVPARPGAYAVVGEDPGVVLSGPFHAGWLFLEFAFGGTGVRDVVVTAACLDGRTYQWRARPLDSKSDRYQVACELPAATTAVTLRPGRSASLVHLRDIDLRRAGAPTCWWLLRSRRGWELRHAGRVPGLGAVLRSRPARAQLYDAFAARREAYHAREPVELVFEPTRSIVREPEGSRYQFTANGDDPQTAIVSPFPTGWVRVHLDGEAEMSSRAELYLIAREGESREDWNICLGRIDTVRTTLERVTYLPAEAEGLRFDPLAGPGGFSIHRLAVEPLPEHEAMQAVLDDLVAFAPLSRLGRKEFLDPLLTAWEKAAPDELRVLLQTRLRQMEHSLRNQYTLFLWERRHERPGAEAVAAELADWSAPPVISLLVPVYNSPEPFLDACIQSVRDQLYPHWQLCLADDGSTAPHVKRVIERHRAEDDRIQVVYNPVNGGISAATNSALELATGEFIGLLDHDDLLTEDALLEMARAIRTTPDVDMLYSDEDKADEQGFRLDPFFKPDWSLDYFLSCMYSCHLGVYRATVLRGIGGFRSEFDTSQDYDMVLRFIERAKRIVHIPKVLYSWRIHSESTAASAANKPHAHFVARRAIQDYLRRHPVGGRVEEGPGPGFHSVRYHIRDEPLVSIVIPTAGTRKRVGKRDVVMVQNLVHTLLTVTEYPNYEVIVVEDGNLSAEVERTLDHPRVQRVLYKEPSFNFSTKVNLGVASARGQHVVLLNDDTEPLVGQWLTAMLELSQLPAVGAVGAKLRFPDGRLQHCGVCLFRQLPGHPFYAAPADERGYYMSAVVNRNYAAVTAACLMTTKALYDELGGFDEAFSLNYNDVDFCLKLVERGLRVVVTPYAELTHFESVSRGEESSGVREWEKALFLERWAARMPRDPYYNPNLSERFGDFRLDIGTRRKEPTK